MQVSLDFQVMESLSRFVVQNFSVRCCITILNTVIIAHSFDNWTITDSRQFVSVVSLKCRCKSSKLTPTWINKASVSDGKNVQIFAHPYFHREGFDVAILTRAGAKRTKKAKVDTIRDLRLLASSSLKRSREMEIKNQELERKYVWLERENHRLTLLVETKPNMYAPRSNTVSVAVLSATVSPDRKNCNFIDHVYVVTGGPVLPSVMDIEPDWMNDYDDLL